MATRRSAGGHWTVKRTILATLMALLCLAILYELWLFCMVVWYANSNPASSSVMRAQLAELRKDDPRAKLKFTWVNSDQIVNNLTRAVIAAPASNRSTTAVTTVICTLVPRRWIST